MSRDAIYTALTTDARLLALGFHGEPNPTVLSNYDGQQRPSDVMFIVLGWGAETVELRGDDSTFVRTARPLEIWVHMYREYSADFVRIDDVLNIIQDVMNNLVQAVGDDGYTLTVAEFSGKSRDLRDDTYQTICRSISYKILSRETEPV
jgi:hypothetical protein